MIVQGCATCVAEREALERAKDQAFRERNRLIALLAHLYPSCLERHPEDDTEWEDDWRWIVFIHHPEGQLSWHIHDSELPLFDHVPRGIGNVKWDGHTIEEKYARIERAIRGEQPETWICLDCKRRTPEPGMGPAGRCRVCEKPKKGVASPTS